jgi:hypothetical protein
VFSAFAFTVSDMHTLCGDALPAEMFPDKLA